MSPTHLLQNRDTPTSQDLLSQWTDPSDILSLLLLVGGDVVRCALAQQAGDIFPTPVVFSFGWVAYAFTAVLSVVGDNLLMPGTPDLSSVVASGEYGHARTNQSWIIGRLLRDFEKYWIPKEAADSLEAMLSKIGSKKVGLCISVFDAKPGCTAGVPQRDFYWYSGYIVALIQLGIAAIPWAIWGQWVIFAITIGGTLLAFAMGSLPQWRHERWGCRRNSHKTFILSRGNGAQHAVVIRGEGRGLDLEDLAVAGDGLAASKGTRLMTCGLATLWVILLITVSGIKERTWFLVAIGTIGMVHTIVIAGAPRRPECFGIHLEYKDVFVKQKVIDTLKAAEEKYPGLGIIMIPIYFPGGLRDDEVAWVEKAKKQELKIKAETKELAAQAKSKGDPA